MSKKRIVVLPGDGIGKEVTREGVRLLETLQNNLNLQFEFEEYPVGGESLKQFGVPIRDEVLEAAVNSDAVLLGAVGSPEFDNNPQHLKPERALLALRRALGVYCNVRPAHVYTPLISASTLKPDVIRGIDILIVRELTGGIYYGQPAEISEKDGQREAVNTMVYTEDEVRRIARMAFRFARQRRKKVTSVDKANVLAVSQLWRQVVEEVSKEFPDVTLEHMLVDNTAMQLIRNPRQFDVIVTGNMFGDILSDEASMLTGSLGMLPSASLGDGPGMYEPVHGTAPDIAGENKANPIAMINSVAMMLRYSFGLMEVAEAIERAVERVLDKKFHTADLNIKFGQLVSTTEMGTLIIQETRNILETNFKESLVLNKVKEMPFFSVFKI
ncbi:MAG: 3-isopropylmalate dehydrogenase [Calditrichia bacterium]